MIQKFNIKEFYIFTIIHDKKDEDRYLDMRNEEFQFFSLDSLFLNTTIVVFVSGETIGLFI